MTTDVTLNIPDIGEQECKVDAEGTISFDYVAMYSAPPFSYALLRKWVEFFGTEEIDTSDGISRGGCESCDYGSEYGFTVKIHKPTKNTTPTPKTEFTEKDIP